MEPGGDTLSGIRPLPASGPALLSSEHGNRRGPDRLFREITVGFIAAIHACGRSISLTEAKAASNLSRRLRVLAHPALLVVDEIGYPPVNRDGAVLFFWLINARHEKASTVLTSNKGFEDWGGVLGDKVMAPLSSTGWCTTATSSTSEITATGCGIVRTFYSPAQIDAARALLRDRRPKQKRQR